MLTFQQRRENLKRLSDAPRRRRELTAVACAEMGLVYGAAEVLPSQRQGFATVSDGFFDEITIPVAWFITNNRGVLEFRGA